MIEGNTDGNWKIVLTDGEAVAVSYSSSQGGRSVYLGKDLLGSVRSATADGGELEDRYEYDAFGKPYAGSLDGMMNLGYTGKPYDTATGLYNYGYRDYSPHMARFTTADPVRDGSNWFAYVNNDHVNWVDPWGLQSCTASDKKGTVNYDERIQAVKEMEAQLAQLQQKPFSQEYLNIMFVRKALEQIGEGKYVYGGKDPQKYGGLDCSGLVYWAAREVTNKNLDILTANGQATSPSFTLPGDNSRGTLNFYYDSEEKRYKHVTINLGNGYEINPFGGEINKINNPADIIITKVGNVALNRQINWVYILILKDYNTGK